MIKSYKGFDKNLSCRGFKYELGKEYEEENAIACEKGFHACENPIDVFSYYPPSDGNRFCMVDQDGIISKNGNDSKVASSKIKISAEIGIIGIAKAAVEYTLSKINFADNKESNTGRRSAATNTGDYSAATNTGDYSAATVESKDSIAVVTGYDSSAKGSLGCWIVLTERNEEYEILHVEAFKVDGKKVKPDTFYKLVNGKLKEA